MVYTAREASPSPNPLTPLLCYPSITAPQGCHDSCNIKIPPLGICLRLITLIIEYSNYPSLVLLFFLMEENLVLLMINIQWDNGAGQSEANRSKTLLNDLLILLVGRWGGDPSMCPCDPVYEDLCNKLVIIQPPIRTINEMCIISNPAVYSAYLFAKSRRDRRLFVH